MSDPTDPTDPEILDNGEAAEPGELSLETPEHDAMEQHLALLEQHDEPLTDRDLEQANPADAAEQHQIVELDEDDYRE